MVRELRQAGIDVWVDDVAVLDYTGRASPMGLKQGAAHSTDVDTVLRDVMPFVSGHKLASEVCIRLTDKILHRFYATNAERKQFTAETVLPAQYGPVGFLGEFSEKDMSHMVEGVQRYLTGIRANGHKEKVFVIENSSGPKELATFSAKTGHQITGPEGCWANTLIQGGISADLALAPQDIIALHA